jgi:hypothetical protein
MGAERVQLRRIPTDGFDRGEEEFREATGHGGAMGYQVRVVEGGTVSVRFDVTCR